MRHAREQEGKRRPVSFEQAPIVFVKEQRNTERESYWKRQNNRI